MLRKAVIIGLAALVGALGGCSTTTGGGSATNGDTAESPAENNVAGTKVPVDAMATAARTAQNNGNLERAAQYWRRVVSVSDEPRFYVAYGRVLRKRGDAERAYLILDENAPERADPSYLVEKGKAALTAGYPHRAVNTFDKAREKKGGVLPPVVRSVFAVALLQDGQSEEAYTKARAAASEAGERVFLPGFNLAMIQVYRGDLGAASKTLEKLAGTPGAPARIDRAHALVSTLRDEETGADVSLTNMDPKARNRVRQWLGLAPKPTGQQVSDGSGVEPGGDQTWYVRVTGKNARRYVENEVRQGASYIARASSNPLRVQFRVTADGRRIPAMMVPVHGWDQAQSLCERVRDAGGRCQIGEKRQLAG